jgi:hypothetical protein
MYYLFRDETLIYVSNTPEGIVAEINSKLANFRTYGGLNFEADEDNIRVFYGKMSTNLLVKAEKLEEVDTFIKLAGTKNF